MNSRVLVIVLLGVALLDCGGDDSTDWSSTPGLDATADAPAGSDGSAPEAPADDAAVVDAATAPDSANDLQDAPADEQDCAPVVPDSATDAHDCAPDADTDPDATDSGDDVDPADGAVESAAPCTDASGCPAGMACDAATGSCTMSCSASSPCNSACCDGAVCRTGDSALACGVPGGMCQDCTASAQGDVCLPSRVCGCSAPLDCPGAAACVAEACAPCPVNEGVCGNQCVDLQNDLSNCGACGKACPGNNGSGCSLGVCNATCDDLIQNGSESDVDCGGSCAPCGLGQSCASPQDCGSNKCVEGTCDCLHLGLPGPPLWLTGPERPTSIATADFDGDGHMDFAVAGDGPTGVVSVHLQRDGEFSTRTDYVAGSYPRGLAAGDLDGDGDIDLAVASKSSGTASVLVNTGSGVFAPSVDYEACPFAGSVAISDLDADGKPDLAVACWLGSAVAVFLNQGGATFAPRVSYPAPYAMSVAAGDLDGDGKPELVVANESGDSADVLHNNGDGTFAPRVSYATGDRPSAVALGDVDQDGDLDAVLAVANTYGISVLLNDASGLLGPHKDYTAFKSSYTPTSLALDDIDADGALDAVFATSNGVGIVGAYRNLGAGTFAIDQAFHLPGTGSSVALRDLNGDGKPELLAGITAEHDDRNNAVSVFVNQGADGFLAAPALPVPNWTMAVAIGDLDGNGKPDLAATGNIANLELRIFFNQGSSSFVQKDFEPCGQMESLAVADFDGDARDDLVATCGLANKLAVMLSRPGQTFATTLYETGEYGASLQTSWVAVGDMNGDKKPDLVAANYEGGTFSVLLNQGDGTFAPHVDQPTSGLPGGIAVGDVDGDGADDVVVAQRALNVVSVYYNEGANTFTRVDQATGPDPISVAVGDFNADGVADLAVANGSFYPYDNGTVSVLLNQGNRVFAPKVDWMIGVNPSGIGVRDLDADGRLDIAITNKLTNSISVLRNAGAGGFERRDWAAGPSPGQLAIDDIDGNGKPDIAIADFDGLVTVLFNQCWD